MLAKQLGLVKTPLHKVTTDVYNYWSHKRQQLKRAILRKYWPQTPLNDTNPHLVFRPREKVRFANGALGGKNNCVDARLLCCCF